MNRSLAVVFVAAAAAFLFLPVEGETSGHRFFSSLRIAKPKTVAAATAANPNRSLPATVGAMLADSVAVTADEPERSVPDGAAAARLAGFPPLLPALRKDAVTLTVLSPRDVHAVLNPSQLRTTFVQAGLGRERVPASLDGAEVRFTTPRSVRAQYGKCPEPVPATIQGQIQGPPPPSTDFGTCLVITETPVTEARVPDSLDVARLVDVGVQLAGMSPAQARAFQARLEWRAAMSATIPRFSRSYDTVDVAGAPGMLFNTVSRRGPTYTLVWRRGNTVFALAGYGSAAEAVPLARSLR